MFLEVAVVEARELDSATLIEPAVYVDSIRDFVRTETAIVKTVLPSIRAQADFERERSRELVAEEQASLADSSKEPEAIAWISDGFSNLMGRLVKVSAKAAQDGHEVTPFSDIDSDSQDNIRRYALAEYLELCSALSPSGEPSKTTYEAAPLLHQSAKSARRLIETSQDLGRSATTRLIMRKPASVEAAIEDARHNIARASEKFPTITRSVILSVVINTKDHEAALRKYAAENNLLVDVGTEQQAMPDAGNFLLTLRQLARARKYDLTKGNPSPTLAEKIARLGQEALEFIDATNGVESTQDIDPEYSILRQGFKKKIEVVAMGANRAWRRGDVPISPEQATPEFRRQLYLRVLEDFLTINTELGGNISYSSVDQNPVQYYSAEEIRQIVANNPDLPPSFLRQIIIQNTEHPQTAIEDFRVKVRDLMEVNPRLIESDAMRMVKARPSISIPEHIEETPDKLSPGDLVESTLLYASSIKKGGSQLARHIRAEIEERQPEIKEYYETLGWSFNGIRLPADARDKLLKTVEKFIITNDRAYRQRKISTRLKDLGPQDRLRVYELLAEDFTGTSTDQKHAVKGVRQVTKEESGQLDSSKSAESNSKRPEDLYRYLRIRFKYGSVPDPDALSEALRQQITEFRERATNWIAGRPEAANIDSPNLEEFLDQLEDYARGSEALGLGLDDSYPRVLGLSATAQTRFIELLYANHSDLNQLTSNGEANGSTKFIIHEFAFFHDAQYLKLLWQQYDTYLPRNLITYSALSSPFKPIDILNGLVEYRAELVKGSPGLSPAEINQALVAKARNN